MIIPGITAWITPIPSPPSTALNINCVLPGASSREAAPRPMASKLRTTLVRSLNKRLMAPPANAISPIINTGKVVSRAAPPKLSPVAWRSVGSSGPIDVSNGRIFKPISTSTHSRGLNQRRKKGGAIK
ncbi:hypothetical protein D3C72_1708070 [compost metagenome]